MAQLGKNLPAARETWVRSLGWDDRLAGFGMRMFIQICFSYFLVDPAGAVLSNQEGVFRSNCMDCLDRTNVIQSLLARRSLQAQLQVHALFFLLLSKQFLKTRNKAHPCALTRLFVVLCPGVHGCSLCMTTVSVCKQF